MGRFKIYIFIITFCLFFFNSKNVVFSAPSIVNSRDNRSSFANSAIPKYEKLEITFNISGTTAINTFYPFDSNPPEGLEGNSGISVDAVFTDPEGRTFSQPAFYYQEYQDLVKGGKEWFYPTGNYFWKVRFTPDKPGGWKYKIIAKDSGGTVQSTDTNFTVADSSDKGFIKVSNRDPRYFEFSNGTYFPAMGYNLPEGVLDNIHPVRGNGAKLQAMNANGMDFSRIWITMYSIYGEAFARWGSSNRFHLTQEPRYGIVNPINSNLTSTFSTYYPGQSPPQTPQGSEYYMWLEFNKTPASDGSLPHFTPCRFFYNIAVKQNTNYKVRVRYQTAGLEGPLDTTKPFGFAVKRAPRELANPTDACNDPNTTGTTTIAATYNLSQVQPDTQNPNWKIMEGIYNTGANDFFGYFYLTFDNVKSTNSDLIAGQVFIDKVWLEEAECTANCPNLIYKPDMDMHTYINQVDAHNFDKLLNLAKQYGIYIKAVMLEKNDRIFQTIDFDGNPSPNQSVLNFHGNGTAINKVRYLQQAWWRYMQARWGYSPNIHSWELLNEGGVSQNHYIQADEFGKYMHCRVFGQEPVQDPNLGFKCNNSHPNSHMVTTSFSGSIFPWQFWNNGGSSAAYKLYRDIDYADHHYYSNSDDSSALASYYDSALFSYKLSTAANFSPVTKKPLVRGETGWGPPGDSYLETNADNGEWLHDFIWAQINHGGLMEHFFAGSHFTRQIFNLSANPVYDNRSMFRPYYNFIKDIPLNNGNYQDVNAVVSNNNIRAWGQKDTLNKRAHLWIANPNHTWYNFIRGYTGGPTAVNIGSVSGNIKITGFGPNENLPITWWNTYTGIVDQTLGSPANNVTADTNGVLTLYVTNLSTDTAVRIGNYDGTSSTPSPLAGDINRDGTVNMTDYNLLTNTFNSSNSTSDLNNDNIVNILDYTILSGNFGRSIQN